MKISSFISQKINIVLFIVLTVGQTLGVHAMQNENNQERERRMVTSKLDFFEIKNDNFWILKNREAFLKASQELINEQGEWKEAYPCAHTIQYTGEFTKNDLSLLEKWLHLKDITYFSLTDSHKSAEYSVIFPWYKQQHIDFTKLIWIKKSSIEYQNQRQSNDLPGEGLKTHNAFYGIK